MSNNQLVLKGQACIQAAKGAYDLIYTEKDTKKAVECLSVLKQDAKLLQKAAEESKKEGAAEERELEKEIDRLTKEKDSYDMTVSRLNKERKDEEYKLSQQRQTLSNAESDLRDAQSLLADAESELRRAKEKEKVAMAAAVTAGVLVGLVTFGIGGAAVAGAAAAGITALVHEIEGKVDKARDKIGSRKNDISRAQSAISSSQQTLSNIERKISDYNGRIANTERQMKEVHEKISENKPTLAVHRQALELWELFAQASENAAETTERLEKIIQKANEKQDLKIITSNGTVKIAKSVVEAWEEISFNQGRITSK